MKYRFIAKEADNYPLVVLFRVMEVKKSSYYEWKAKGAKIIPAQELALRRRMKELFERSRQSLGSRRMRKQLRLEGYVIGRYRVRKLMQLLNLKVKVKKKYKITTHSDHSQSVAENILDRRFNPSKPNRVWAADITYVWTCEGWLYVAIVMDLYSRRIVGWCIDKRQTKSLVLRALIMAISLRQPPRGLIHHSDRGSQYASVEYRKLLNQHGLICSMSRKANCWDNSPVERFFSSLKREWIGDLVYRTRQAAINDIREYIAIYYNAKRLHSTLGYQTPVDFEKGLNDVSGNS